MMRFLSLLFLHLFFSLAQSYGQGPDIKIGHVDQQHIFENLPEFKKLNQEIIVKSEQYDQILKGKYDEFTAKSAAFEKLSGSQTSEAILQDRARELDNLKKSYEEFQANSMAELRNYYSKKFTPIKKKVNDAIVFAGRQHGYAFILRMDLNPDGGDIWPVVLYAGDSTSNLTKDILRNLAVNSDTASVRKVGIEQMLKKK